jgi:hypothetical protein
MVVKIPVMTGIQQFEEGATDAERGVERLGYEEERRGCGGCELSGEWKFTHWR